MNNTDVPIWEKYTLTIEEASKYFRIGEKKLRKLAEENIDAVSYTHLPSKGITVILSSHILSEVQLIADDIGIISNGILGYEGQMNKDENLENLFVEVVRKSQEER